MDPRHETVLSDPAKRIKVALSLGLSEDATAEQIEACVATRPWTLEQVLFERDPEAPHPTPFAEPLGS